MKSLQSAFDSSTVALRTCKRRCISRGAFLIAVAAVACYSHDATTKRPGDLSWLAANADSFPVVVHVGSTPICSECTINVSRVVTLGAEGDSLAPDDFSLVERSASGHFFAYDDSRTRILVYDDSGKLVRSLGTKGKGPGEFSSIANIAVGPNDSLFVFDNDGNALMVFDRNLTFVREFALPFSPRALQWMPFGQFALTGDYATRDYAGFPIHLVSAEGAFVRSIGAENPRYRADKAVERFRRVVAGPNAATGTLWAAHSDRYQLELWDTAGQHLSSIVRQASWFPPRDTGRKAVPYYEGPPQPSLYMFRRDGAGRLWTFSGVPDQQWKPDPSVATLWRESGSDTAIYPRFYDMIIEVLDDVTGSVIASRRWEGMNNGGQIGQSGLFYSRRRLASSAVVIDVWRAALTPEDFTPPSSRNN